MAINCCNLVRMKNENRNAVAAMEHEHSKGFSKFLNIFPGEIEKNFLIIIAERAICSATQRHLTYTNVQKPLLTTARQTGTTNTR